MRSVAALEAPQDTQLQVPRCAQDDKTKTVPRCAQDDKIKTDRYAGTRGYSLARSMLITSSAEALCLGSCALGAIQESPPLQRWESVKNILRVPSGTAQNACGMAALRDNLCRARGTRSVFGTLSSPLKRWAFLCCARGATDRDAFCCSIGSLAGHTTAGPSLRSG